MFPKISNLFNRKHHNQLNIFYYCEQYPKHNFSLSSQELVSEAAKEKKKLKMKATQHWTRSIKNNAGQ